MHCVTDVKYINDYKLKLTFENGIKKLVDLKAHLEGEIFEPLKDIDYFQKVSLNKDIDTIVWDNEADFCPDFLFSIGT